MGITMSEASVYETRNNLSAVIDNLASGKIAEHVIKRRNTPVARIVPIVAESDTSKRIGLTRKNPLLLDDDAFDALDAEVAKLFGV